MPDAPYLTIVMSEEACRREEEQPPASFPQSRIGAINALQDRSYAIYLPIEILQPVESGSAIMRS